MKSFAIEEAKMLCETLDRDTYSMAPSTAVTVVVEDENSQSSSTGSICDQEIDTNAGTHIITGNGTSTGNNENGNVANANFFEGAEKRLAIYFKDDDDDDDKNKALDLRKITRSQWKQVLDLVNCQVLNVTANDHYDAYLLSESSLFVAKNCFILKTCGSTTLLNCLEMILNVVFNLGFDSIEDVFYSHKNLLVPSMQPQPHHSFLKESEFLDKVFNGHSHLFGHINADRWYLYTMDYPLEYGMNAAFSGNEHFKFEMMMEELDEKVMRIFYKEDGRKTAAQATRKSGIDSIIPGMVIDDYLFSPCGYSMNGLLGKYYMTIHITPEPDFSYVSVETNMPQKSYASFIGKLVEIFKPGKFMLNLFVPSIFYLKSNGLDHEDGIGGKKSKSSLMETAAVNVHGMMIYEALGCGTAGTGGRGGCGGGRGFTDTCRYRRCDFQMAQTEQMDIIYARYVSEGIS